MSADEAYGKDEALRRLCRDAGIGYVLAVPKDHRVTTIGGGKGREHTTRADQAAANMSARGWLRRTCGKGAKGEREYEWGWMWLVLPDDQSGGRHWLLIRRSSTDGELAFYRCWSPVLATLQELVSVAGCRWSIEDDFKAGKNLCGLDEHQVRTWSAWYGVVQMSV